MKRTMSKMLPQANHHMASFIEYYKEILNIMR